MMTRGSWAKSVKLVGVAGIVCGLLILTTFRNAGKRWHQTSTGVSPVATEGTSGLTSAKDDPRWSDAYGKLPLSFEENQGQMAREVRFVSHGSGYELFLTPQEAVLALRPNQQQDLTALRRVASHRAMRKAHKAGSMTAIRMSLEGANPNPQIAGVDRLPAKVNYFIGNDPTKWHTGVPSYARVKYADVYPGVDLIFYGNQRRLEYDFIVAPGADPKAITLKVDGARQMRTNSRGDLVLSVSNGQVEFQKPDVYQIVNGERRAIDGGYEIAKDHRVTFAVDSYDHREPLILDPVLNYSTYLGGSAADGGFAIALDAAGDAFVAGQTASTDFPPGAKGGVSSSPTPNKGVSFVAELDPTGKNLLYSTYLGGTSSNPFEQAFGVAVDTSGKVYVTGLTYAINFPTTSNALKVGPNNANINGTSYITKLDPAQSGVGSLLYSSYLGGTNGTALLGGDVGQSIAVDSSNPANGIVYVAGYTDSTPSTTVTSLPNFPIVNGFQTTLNCSNGNAFLSKIDTTKSGAASLLYSTYVGGTCAHAAALLGFGEDAFGVAVTASGNAYLAGATSSIDFPTFGNAHQPTPPAGNLKGTGFLTQIDTTQTGAASQKYSTYLGGSSFDQANAIALGPGNVVYVTGVTNSSDFPVQPKPGAFDTSGAAASKAFVSLFDTTLAAVPSLKYSTFLGGTGGDVGYGIKVDAAGNAYVGGTTSSKDFPMATARGVGAFKPTYPAGALSLGFISKLNPAGGGSTDLLYSTYFGGSGNASNGDHIFAIAIDAANPANAYVTGQTYSANFPVLTPLASGGALNGPSDAFVSKLTPIATLTVAPATLNFGAILIPNTSPAQSVTLTNNTNAAITFTSATISGGSPAAANTDYTVSANTCSGAGGIPANGTCTVSVTLKPSVAATETATLVLTDGDSTSPQSISLTGSGTTAPPDFTVTAPSPQTVAAGSQVSFTVTVTSTGGFNSAVALTCTGAPLLSTCTPAPASVTPAANGTATSTVTVTTTAMMVPPPSAPNPPISMRQIVPLVLALLLLFLLPATRRMRTRLTMATAMIIFIALAGCSGPRKPGTPKGPATLTITGTSGSLSHSATVTLTVT